MTNRRYLALLPVLAATLYGCAGGSQGSGANTAIGGGSFTLAPGETKTIRASNTYRTIRICNDVGSAGTIEGAVGDYPSATLAPGVCNANMGYYGDRITVQNISSGTATGIFQSSGTKPIGRGGAGR